DRLGRGGLGRSRFERLDREQRIDRGWFRLCLVETVAGRERRLLEYADAVDEPVEMLSEPGVRAGAVGQLEQRIKGAIEFSLRAEQVANRELLPAGFEVLVRGRDQDRNRIRRWFLNGNRCSKRRR